VSYRSLLIIYYQFGSKITFDLF